MTESGSLPPDERSGDGEAAPAPLPPRRLGLVALVAVALLIVDQLSKTLALRHLTNGPRNLVGSLRLNLLYNTGVAFSQGSGKGLGPWISVLALTVVVAVSLGATSRTTIGAVASGLISGGAIGNLADRAFRGDAGFLHGAVVDFIDLQWWPVFNVADAAIVVGAGLLVVASFRVPRS
jgi:signal peptidase II